MKPAWVREKSTTFMSTVILRRKLLSLISPPPIGPITFYGVYIQVHFRLDFFIESNNMNPNQTTPYWLQYRLQYNYK